LTREQEQLLAEYARRWPELRSALRRLAPTASLSFPLLVDIDVTQAVGGLLIVGQETKGWGDGDLSLDVETLPVTKLLGYYAEWTADSYSSPFWNAVKALHGAMNLGPFPKGLAWTNVFKLDEEGGPPTDRVADCLRNAFNLLPFELSVIRPRAVVLFTGRYDSHLSRMLEGMRFENVPGFSSAECSLVRHELLPKFSFRTYHPGFLRRSGRWRVIQHVAEQLVCPA